MVLKNRNYGILIFVLSITVILLISILFYFLLNTNTNDNFNNNNNLINNNNSNNNKTLILGFCPTMEQEAKNIALNNNNIQLIKYHSTIDVLGDLNKDKIDIGLVGRVAKSNELKEGFNELRLAQGLTLITKQKSAILYNQLANIKIHTYLLEEEVESFLQNTENIIYYEKINYAITAGINDAILIDWKDYKDEYELLIPVNQNNQKIKEFRIPVLYSYKNLEQIKLIEK